MESVSYNGLTNPFEGFILDSEKYKGASFTFFTRYEAFIYRIVNETDTSKSFEIHDYLSKLIAKEVEFQYSMESADFFIDLTPLVDETKDYFGLSFELEVEEVACDIKNATSTLYNTYLTFNGHLYPITNIETGNKATNLYFGSQLMLEVATDLERFPSLVSYNIIQRHIDLVAKERILGKKLINLNKILAKGLHVSYMWTL